MALCGFVCLCARDSEGGIPQRRGRYAQEAAGPLNLWESARVCGIRGAVANKGQADGGYTATGRTEVEAGKQQY